MIITKREKEFLILLKDNEGLPKSKLGRMLGIFNLNQINKYIDKFFDYGYLYIKKDKNKILLFPTPKLIDDVFFKKI